MVLIVDQQHRFVTAGLAMDGANVVRLKPQNLLVNLPTAVSA